MFSHACIQKARIELKNFATDIVGYRNKNAIAKNLRGGGAGLFCGGGGGGRWGGGCCGGAGLGGIALGGGAGG